MPVVPQVARKGFLACTRDTYATVVLAAGKGTRMRSALPKLLHPLAGVPLLAHVLKAVEAIPSSSAFVPLATRTTTHRPIVILGHEAGQVMAVFGGRCSYAIQEEQLGTGHATLAARDAVDALEPLPQTVLVGIASSQGRVIATVKGASDETIGINDRVQLAAAEQVLRRRILERHMYAGVTITDPVTTYIDDEVVIGTDMVILPGTMITGKTRIGSECRIGPGTTIDQSTIGDRCIVRSSALEETTFEDDVRMGPFSHCRPGAHLAHGVRMGNFAEVKNSYIGAETDMHHFSYAGDATIGEHVNIGAGVVTVNYDGKLKHRTIIGKGAFIGCDTMLIAPVEVGDGAITGAGAVVNRDVPAGR